LQPRQFHFCPPREDCNWLPGDIDCSPNSTKTCACIAVNGSGPNATCDQCDAAIICVNGTKTTSISQGTPTTIPPFPTNAPTSVCHNECSRIAGYAQCTSTAPYVCVCSVMLLDAPRCSQCLEPVAPAAASEVAKSLDICRTLPPCASPCTGPFTTSAIMTSNTIVRPSQSSSFPAATTGTGTSTVQASQAISASSSGHVYSLTGDSFGAFWFIVALGVACLASLW
jgi:hypothetical protein